MSAGTGSFKAPLTAPAGTTVGGVLKLQNPEGVDLIVTRLLLDIEAAAAGVTVDAGIDDEGDTSSDNLIDGGSVAATGVIDNISDAGTNGKAAVLWPAGHHLVITASGAGATLKGTAHVQWVRRA